MNNLCAIQIPTNSESHEIAIQKIEYVEEEVSKNPLQLPMNETRMNQETEDSSTSSPSGQDDSQDQSDSKKEKKKRKKRDKYNMISNEIRSKLISLVVAKGMRIKKVSYLLLESC
jgi:hypothetical protein